MKACGIWGRWKRSIGLACICLVTALLIGNGLSLAAFADTAQGMSQDELQAKPQDGQGYPPVVTGSGSLLEPLDTPYPEYDAVYYVSADGDDSLGDGSLANPWATLAKTASVTNLASESGKDYLVIVMTDLVSSACARYYTNNITITSLDARVRVSRATVFSTQSDVYRGWYNPAMLEIGNGGENLHTHPNTLTLQNIVFDDAGLRPAGTGHPHNFSGWLNIEQDAIVATYDSACTIVLGPGAELLNFGGQTAIHAVPGNVELMAGSLISDTTVASRLDGHGGIYGTRGDAAVRIIGSNSPWVGRFTMHQGARITNIADAHGIAASGHIAFAMDGEITGLRGGACNDGLGEGRGSKNAININAITYDPYTGEPGPAVIGPFGLLANNQVKSGTVQVRSGNCSLSIYGKVNNNQALAGVTYVLGFTIAAGTNGGGLYIIAGGTVYLQEGAEVCGNSVVSSAYGGAASVQQGNARLVVNGGLISGNTGPSWPGVAVNKNSAGLVMNGGRIDNGLNAVALLTDNSIQTNGTLAINDGWVSGVTVQSTNVFGRSTERFANIGENAIVNSGYVNVAGRNVYLQSKDIAFGNPNTESYTAIRNALPAGWSMPSNNNNVIGFWVNKPALASFSVPRPTSGSGGTGYLASYQTYIAAVIEVGIDGKPLPGAITRFYPTEVIGNQIHVISPLDAYPSGVNLALVQPTGSHGILQIDGPSQLAYHLGAADYGLSYTAVYEMPAGLHQLLQTFGHTAQNTSLTLVLRPYDPLFVGTVDLVMQSDLLELAGSPVWLDGELVVSLALQDGWEGLSPSELASLFYFSCSLAQAGFVDGGFLYLSGEISISGGTEASPANYHVFSNIVTTEMYIPVETVTFDANGGDLLLGDDSRSVLLGEALGVLMPEDPSREGYAFIGWNTASDGSGAAFTSGTAVSESLTVFAQWEQTNDPPGTGADPDPDPGLGTSEEPGQAQTPQTGDNASAFMNFLAACLISGLSCLLIHTRSRRIH
ncbi:MAG: InlB B-repeat-containing protein [Coriobacteriia bacterium]|nr:InlB B-repeat-containing protein [Coriobacteriia bacterium]